MKSSSSNNNNNNNITTLSTTSCIRHWFFLYYCRYYYTGPLNTNNVTLYRHVRLIWTCIAHKYTENNREINRHYIMLYNSAVSTVTRLWAGEPRNRSSMQAKDKRFLISNTSRTGQRPVKPPGSTGSGDLSPSVERPGRKTYR